MRVKMIYEWGCETAWTKEGQSEKRYGKNNVCFKNCLLISIFFLLSSRSKMQRLWVPPATNLSCSWDYSSYSPNIFNPAFTTRLGIYFFLLIKDEIFNSLHSRQNLMPWSCRFPGMCEIFIWVGMCMNLGQLKLYLLRYFYESIPLHLC